MNDQTGCLTCDAGFYSAGGTVNECTKCDADKYSEAGATQCTDCPSGKGVASGEGKQESDCKAKDLGNHTWVDWFIIADIVQYKTTKIHLHYYGCQNS